MASAPVRAGAVDRLVLGWATDVADWGSVVTAMGLPASVRPGVTRAATQAPACWMLET